MNKAQEIKTLNDFIHSLPKQTYLFEALNSQKYYFENQINSDFCPDFITELKFIEQEKTQAKKQLSEINKQIEDKKTELQEINKKYNRLNDEYSGVISCIKQAKNILNDINLPQ